MDADTQTKIHDMNSLLSLARRLRKAAEYASPDRRQVIIETFGGKECNRKVTLQLLSEAASEKIRATTIEILREKLVMALNDAAACAEDEAEEILQSLK